MNNNNKRIASNSLVLYIRMIFVLGISLFTSRIILKALGVDDYGIYVVIGGIVALLGFLNSCATSTQRFLNYELGRSNVSINNLKLLFSNALSIHLIIGVIMVILAETVGLWFVNNKLIIPHNQLFSANIIYQSSIIILFLSVLQMPYMADVIAHEKMNIYAYISIIDTILKLMVAISISFFNNHRLIYYGFLLVVVQTLVTGVYVGVCKKQFDECGFSLSYDKKIFKELFKFTGWNMFGSVAWLAKTQGLGIILNLFYGVALNAAKGISDQVSNAVNTLSNNFQIALNPQITKNYASKEFDQMEKLAYRGVKFSCVLLWLIGLPLILNIKYILFLWLGNAPDYSSIFIILAIIEILISNLFGSPIMASISATGNIRNYQITVSLILLLILPASYIALKLGSPPQSIYIMNIIFSFIAGVTRLLFCVKQVGFSLIRYVKTVFFPIMGIILISSTLPILEDYLINPSEHITFGTFIISVLLSITCVIITAWYLAFNNIERNYIKTIIKKKLISVYEGKHNKI